MCVDNGKNQASCWGKVPVSVGVQTSFAKRLRLHASGSERQWHGSRETAGVAERAGPDVWWSPWQCVRHGCLPVWSVRRHCCLPPSAGGCYSRPRRPPPPPCVSDCRPWAWPASPWARRHCGMHRSRVSAGSTLASPHMQTADAPRAPCGGHIRMPHIYTRACGRSAVARWYGDATGRDGDACRLGAVMRCTARP